MGISRFTTVPLLARSTSTLNGALSRISTGASSLSKFKESLRTWRGTTIAGIVIMSLVLLVNLGLLIWSYAVPGHTTVRGLLVVQTAECKTVHYTSIVIHLFINIFGNLLLGASNFCMQALSAPTREDVDKAHQRGKWLSIGTFSTRNFYHIPWKRTMVCCILALSSIPLAFLYNAVVVELLAANAWQAVIVQQSIFDEGPRIPINDSLWSVDPLTWSTDPLEWNATIITPDGQKTIPYESYTPWTAWKAISLFSNGKGGFRDLKKLSVEECRAAYNNRRVTEYRNLLLVTNIMNASTNVLSTINDISLGSDGFQGSDTGTESFCFNAKLSSSMESCTYDGPKNWTIRLDTMLYSLDPEGSKYPDGPAVSATIDHCMVEEVHVPCQLGISRPLLIAVVVSNILKVLCLLYGLNAFEFKPLVTIGDALDSFLTRPDRTTEYQSGLSKPDVQKKLWSPLARLKTPRGRKWHQKRHRWASTASPYRWAWTMLLGGGTLLFSIILAALELPQSLLNFAPSAFGESTREALYHGEQVPSGPITNAVIANIPQMLISTTYIFYNGVFTSMLLVQEFSSYSTKRSGLRVSQPRKGQRGTYFLSLPFRYSAPLMILMMLLHWLVSQAIFPVYVRNYDIYGAQAPDDNFGSNTSIDTFGYSGNAFVISIIIGGLILLALPILGRRRYPRGFAFAGNCSVALSAACHPLHPSKPSSVNDLDKYTDIGGQQLKYGILDEREFSDSSCRSSSDTSSDGGLENTEAKSDLRPKRLGFSAHKVRHVRDGDIVEAPVNATDTIDSDTGDDDGRDYFARLGLTNSIFLPRVPHSVFERIDVSYRGAVEVQYSPLTEDSRRQFPDERV